MASSKIVLITSNIADHKHAATLAEAAHLELVKPRSWKEVLSSVSGALSSYVLWAVDDPEMMESSHPLSLVSVADTLFGLADPVRVFSITEKPIHHYQDLLSRFSQIKPRFHHNIVRRFPPGSEKLYARLLDFSRAHSPAGLSRFFDSETKIQKLSLKNSSQKNTAVNALEKTLIKTGFDERISAKVAQAADELIMNAIFDAARDRSGIATRQMLDRRAMFEFPPHESIDIEFALDPLAFAICVTDHYGSIKKETVFQFLHQNFQDKNYQIRKYGPGAGLGLYGIAASGLSLLISCDPGRRTDVVIFFPRVKSYLEFRKSFQFTAFF